MALLSRTADFDSACGIPALRLYYSSHEAKSNDKTYWLAKVGLWGAVEIAMVISCGCFTSFPRFLRWLRDERTGSGSRQYKKSYGYASETQSRSYGYGSESRSRLRYDTPSPMEMGRLGVMNEVRAVHQEWRTLGYCIVKIRKVLPHVRKPEPDPVLDIIELYY